MVALVEQFLLNSLQLLKGHLPRRQQRTLLILQLIAERAVSIGYWHKERYAALFGRHNSLLGFIKGGSTHSQRNHSQRLSREDFKFKRDVIARLHHLARN